jgi:D-alanyl-D-alanine dipeptidase
MTFPGFPGSGNPEFSTIFSTSFDQLYQFLPICDQSLPIFDHFRPVAAVLTKILWQNYHNFDPFRALSNSFHHFELIFKDVG